MPVLILLFLQAERPAMGKPPTEAAFPPEREIAQSPDEKPDEKR